MVVSNQYDSPHFRKVLGKNIEILRISKKKKNNLPVRWLALENVLSIKNKNETSIFVVLMDFGRRSLGSIFYQNCPKNCPEGLEKANACYSEKYTSSQLS
jgi:hypothetical protein